MQVAPLPPDESDRLDELRALNLLDSDFEQAYDDLARLAGQICQTPIALISLIDEKRQWFKSVVGLGVRETSRDIAFCSHAILQPEAFVIPDATADARFADNPLVTGNPNIRFYAGIPLVTQAGHALGTLCAIDRRPRVLTDGQLTGLRILAAQAIRLFELRAKNLEITRINSDKTKILSVVAHDLRSPLSGVMILSTLLHDHWAEYSIEEREEALSSLVESSQSTVQLVNNIVDWASTENGRVVVKLNSVALSGVLRELRREVEGLLRVKKLHWVSVCPEQVTVLADPVLLHSILGNLAGNAVKFCRHGGKIEITAAVTEKIVKISVADDGVGLTATQLARWNDDDLGSTRGTSGEWGSGLGLNLAKDFVKRLRGNLAVELRATGGTVFSFCLEAGLPK